MSVTPANDLAGILPVVISGGRPALTDRRTATFLPVLHGVTADPVWMVRDDQAPAYEHDGHELVTYPRAEAEAYAAAHWTGVEPFQPGGFLGAFCGREWACRLAENRGYWAVLQLDDNLIRLSCFIGYQAAKETAERHGGLALYADLLAAVTQATNSRMTGGFLESVAPGSQIRPRYIARAGFPYSVFLEVTGPGREEWHGPFEDDILHAWQYAANPTTATAALVPALLYKKEPRTKVSGMRAAYATHTRAAGLQRVAPEMAQIRIMAAASNGRGGPRLFHRMTAGIIAAKSPLVVTDPDRYGRVGDVLNQIATEVAAGFRENQITRAATRAAKWDQP